MKSNNWTHSVMISCLDSKSGDLTEGQVLIEPSLWNWTKICTVVVGNIRLANECTVTVYYSLPVSCNGLEALKDSSLSPVAVLPMLEDHQWQTWLHTELNKPANGRNTRPPVRYTRQVGLSEQDVRQQYWGWSSLEMTQVRSESIHWMWKIMS